MDSVSTERRRGGPSEMTVRYMDDGIVDMDQWQAVALGLIPSVGIGFLFYKVIRLILEGDRNERLAHARWEAEHAEGPVADRVQVNQPTQN